MEAKQNIVKKIWEINFFRILAIACGIIISFVIFGILEEQIMKKCYERDSDGKCVQGEKYEFEITFVGVMTAMYAISAKLLLQIKTFNTNDTTHQGWYMATSFVYAFSLISAMTALRWIAYPVQVITRSSKPISVMLLGLVLCSKRYSIQKYVFVLMIVGGVVMFIYNDGDSHESNTNQTTIALVLIIVSILSEGVVGVIQDRMRATTKPSALHMMFSINMYIVLFVSIAAVVTGDVFGFIKFVRKHPDILLRITSASLVGSLGQVFVYMMVSGFGALACSITTTTRKLFTVLISVTLMGNALTVRQDIAIVIVFGALFADAYWGKKKGGEQQNDQKQTKVEHTPPEIALRKDGIKDTLEIESCLKSETV